MVNHFEERKKDVELIKGSTHARKVVVAGPGTGKSFLFTELIRKKMGEGKSNFLAITFIGKLGDSLADDLCGLAPTMTMHGFARQFVLSRTKSWEYYPKMYDLIKDDLKAEGIDEFEIGDEDYKRKTLEYKAVGDTDVIVYAVQICKKSPEKVPSYDLILVDEYQDFNAIESEFVDILAEKNEIVIVGDDDQALYEFKGSSPSFIRSKYSPDNANYESHTLRFCSRCPEVIIKYFHDLVDAFDLNNEEKGRIQKEYLCYEPDKKGDSEANPKLHLIKNCPPGMIAYKIGSELSKMVSEQKIKSALVIGEGQSCKPLLTQVAKQLESYGFANVDFRDDSDVLSLNQDVIDAYKFISKDKDSKLGWRILNNPNEAERKVHIKNAATLDTIINKTPSEVRKLKVERVDALEEAIENTPVADKAVRQDFLYTRLRKSHKFMGRPMRNLELTVCNILNSKGLGADVVFLIGFDQGRLPKKKEALDSEVYQMLVAITRAKKRVYLINGVEKDVSNFIDHLDKSDLKTEVIKAKK